MNLRAVIATVVAVSSGVVMAVTGGTSVASPPSAEEVPEAAPKPNIVLIMTDDMRLDDLKFMPATRALIGNRGVRFTRARSSDSLCCPARATILTGKYAHNHRTIGNYAHEFGGFPYFRSHNDVNDLLPTWLKQQGYRTGYLGKYLNGFAIDADHDQPGWDLFAVPRGPIYNYNVNRFWLNGEERTFEGYREHFQRGLMLEMLDRWGAEEEKKPYFMWYNSLAPHNPYNSATKRWTAPTPEPKYQGTVSNSAFRVSPAVTEDLRDKPRWVRFRATQHRRGFHFAEARGRAMALKSVDDTVRTAVEKVRAQGEEDRTLFIFTSDNGIMLGEHELGGKAVPFEESTRIPLLVSGPGFPAGGVVNQEVSLNDVVAAVVHASGDTAVRPLDGVALQQFVQNPGLLTRRPTMLESTSQVLRLPRGRTYPHDSIGRGYRGVAWRNWVYVTYLTGEREFYDLGRDRWQLTNRARTRPPSWSVQARLARWLRANQDCVGAACSRAVP